MPDRPLRILQVLRAPIGGLFRHVADLTEALAERGHELGIVVDSLVSDAQTAGKLDRLRPFARLGIHPMPMPRLLGPGDLSTPIQLSALAHRLGVDVLHGHGAKGGLHARLARGKGRVALYTPHGGVLHFPPKSPSGRLFGWLERRLMGRTDVMVFESAFARQAFAQQIVEPSCPTRIIHNGLAPAEFVAVAPEPEAADFAYVGELRALKGIFPLIEAIAALAEAGRPATLVMAGDGPDRPALVARIAELGLGEKVRLLGVQPARSVFAKGRTVVVPSLAESLPYVVLEAAAAGRPLIATRVGGIPEIFGPTAWSLVPPGDSAALAVAMRAGIEEPAAADAEAMRRLAHVRSGFSLKAMTDSVEEAYRSALD